jgi:hypothetical protein
VQSLVNVVDRHFEQCSGIIYEVKKKKTWSFCGDDIRPTVRRDIATAMKPSDGFS